MRVMDILLDMDDEIDCGNGMMGYLEYRDVGYCKVRCLMNGFIN